MLPLSVFSVYSTVQCSSGRSQTASLTYLSRYFNTSEINATFYRHFEPEIAKKWSEAVENPEFEFAIKANQVFTHGTERIESLRFSYPVQYSFAFTGPCLLR